MVKRSLLSATAFLPRQSLVCGSDLICSIRASASRNRSDDHARQTLRSFSEWVTTNGGPGRDRTGDLIVANDALSQLSYRPTYYPEKQYSTRQHTCLFWH